MAEAKSLGVTQAQIVRLLVGRALGDDTDRLIAREAAMSFSQMKREIMGRFGQVFQEALQQVIASIRGMPPTTPSPSPTPDADVIRSSPLQGLPMNAPKGRRR
jgi:hypothetical protein